MLSGEEVVVYTPTVDASDPEQARTYTEATVSNVLVAPGSTSDSDDSMRPAGTTVALTLGFPKTFGASLKNCRVKVRGSVYDVIGDPQPNSSSNCPTDWWLTAEVTRTDG